MPTWFPIVASIALAVIPVIIWLGILIKKEEARSLYIKTFLAGTLAVVPPFLLILLFNRFPNLDFYAQIQNNIRQAALASILTNVMVAIIEEVAKNMIVRVIDKRHPEHIQTISSALKLSICAGLGFSFAENIFYFYNISINYSYTDLFSAFIFRSAFTTCGHMVFSGIFGYYFGLGKFAADITELSRWEGKSMWFSRLIGKIPGKATFEMVREQMNSKGLMIALTLHAVFNASLDLEHKLPSIFIVVFSGFFIAYLLNTQYGRLLFSIGKRRGSTMAAKDEDVVMELLGMWTNQGKYEEVMQICDRLLQRDPDNNVVRMFKAKAADDTKLRQFYNSLKSVFGKNTVNTSAIFDPTKSLNIANEKVVLEVMDMWFKEGKYGQVLDIANNLLKRNPKSEGAKILLQKAMDKDKLQRIFDSLSKLFSD
ncbi:MAG: PrsW family glutamic-type intramembrane protease [Patescibacteria group bacterium]